VQPLARDGFLMVCIRRSNARRGAILKDEDTWVPTKYVSDLTGFRATRDTADVAISSRLVADAVARFYGQTIPEYARGNLLDLGCGNVPLFGLYRPYIADSVCVDWEQSLHANSHLDQVQDINKPLELASESFDTVILSDVLEHVADPASVLMEISRVLKSDGVLLLNVPFMYWLHESPNDYYRFTQYALRRLTESAGLRIIDISPIGGVPEVLTDITSKTLMMAPVGNTIGKFAAWILQTLTAAFLRTSFGSNVSRKTGAVFPLGYALIATKPSSSV
jgi:SAM-dependent methyltransferase